MSGFKANNWHYSTANLKFISREFWWKVLKANKNGSLNLHLDLDVSPPFARDLVKVPEALLEYVAEFWLYAMCQQSTKTVQNEDFLQLPTFLVQDGADRCQNEDFRFNKSRHGQWRHLRSSAKNTKQKPFATGKVNVTETSPKLERFTAN